MPMDPAMTVVVAVIGLVLTIMMLKLVWNITLSIVKIGVIGGILLLGATALNMPVDLIVGDGLAEVADGVTGMVTGGVELPDATNATNIINATNTSAVAEQAKETILDVLLDGLTGALG